MAHDEAPIGKFLVNEIIFTTKDGTDAPIADGQVKLSGSKLWFGDGANWELVNSA